jgi:hypothetical protein
MLQKEAGSLFLKFAMYDFFTEPKKWAASQINQLAALIY